MIRRPTKSTAAEDHRNRTGSGLTNNVFRNRFVEDELGILHSRTFGFGCARC